jgi:hypothetical protein
VTSTTAQAVATAISENTAVNVESRGLAGS